MESTVYGERLRAVMKALGRRQRDLGEAVGVSQAAVSKWMLGEAAPEFRQLVAISRWLDVSVDYLLDDSEEIDRDALAMRRLVDAEVRRLGLSEAYRRLTVGPAARSRRPRKLGA